MYFLGDLVILQELVNEASEPGHGPKPKDSDPTGLDENITAGTPTPTDSDLAKSTEKEDLDNGT